MICIFYFLISERSVRKHTGGFSCHACTDRRWKFADFTYVPLEGAARDQVVISTARPGGDRSRSF